MELTDHQCKRTRESGKVFASHYDPKQEKKVYYCHYCGENVSESEYIEVLERRFKSIQVERDKYKEALKNLLSQAPECDEFDLYSACEYESNDWKAAKDKARFALEEE